MSFDRDKLNKEINELEMKKAEIKFKVAEAKKGKNFLQRTGITIGAGSKLSELNRGINERKKIIGLMNQKESLKSQKEIANLQMSVMKDRQKIQDAKKQSLKALNDEVFSGIDEMFKI